MGIGQSGSLVKGIRKDLGWCEVRSVSSGHSHSHTHAHAGVDESSFSISGERVFCFFTSLGVVIKFLFSLLRACAIFIPLFE